MGLGDAEVRKRSGVDPTTADMDTSKPAINSVQVSKPTGPLMIHFENQGEVNTHTHRERERERERDTPGRDKCETKVGIRGRLVLNSNGICAPSFQRLASFLFVPGRDRKAISKIMCISLGAAFGDMAAAHVSGF
jgi:hypothetical protein